MPFTSLQQFIMTHNFSLGATINNGIYAFDNYPGFIYDFHCFGLKFSHLVSILHKNIHFLNWQEVKFKG